MPLDLTISIINHSNPDMLRDCLRSIFPSTYTVAFEIYVVDNATDGKLVEEIRAEFPQVKWIFNKHPMGFSANHNQILLNAASRYACILNDDTVLHQGVLDELVAFLDRNPDFAMAGPRLLNPDGSIQNSTFHDKTLMGECIDILLLPGFAAGLKRRGVDEAQFGQRSASVDWILGACIVIRAEALEEIGLLDEQLSPIANCEEVDWCRRARKAGWKIGLVPDASILHYGGQSQKRSKPGADFFRVEKHRAILAYFQKHFGRMRWLFLRWIYIATLPWNGFMLAQSVLRGRTNKDEAASNWATFLQISRVALKPQRSVAMDA